RVAGAHEPLHPTRQVVDFPGHVVQRDPSLDGAANQALFPALLDLQLDAPRLRSFAARLREKRVQAVAPQLEVEERRASEPGEQRRALGGVGSLDLRKKAAP